MRIEHTNWRLEMLAHKSDWLLEECKSSIGHYDDIVASQTGVATPA